MVTKLDGPALDLNESVSAGEVHESATDIAKLLRETAVVVDREYVRCGPLRIQARELEFEQAVLKWQLDKDDLAFLDRIAELRAYENEKHARLAKERWELDKRIKVLRESNDELNLRVRSQEPGLIKVIVELDMARYSDICADLDKQAGTQAIVGLNKQFKKWVTDSIKKVGADPKTALLSTAGDGAIVAFDKAEQGSDFAEFFHQQAESYSSDKRKYLERRHFRVGIAMGNIILAKIGPDIEKEADMAGTTIATAVRLEAACCTGEVLIDTRTYAFLPPEHRHLYGKEETVFGKREERIQAHRRKVADPAPWEKNGRKPK